MPEVRLIDANALIPDRDYYEPYGYDAVSCEQIDKAPTIKPGGTGDSYMDKIELHRALTRVLVARIPKDCADDLELLRNYIENSEPVQRGRWIEENSVSEGYLSDWYISSVDNTETPIWTDDHIEEVCRDFWLIPKTGMGGEEPLKENE